MLTGVQRGCEGLAETKAKSKTKVKRKIKKNLVIVESPAKAKTIEKYLGKEYMVRATMRQLRD